MKVDLTGKTDDRPVIPESIFYPAGDRPARGHIFFGKNQFDRPAVRRFSYFLFRSGRKQGETLRPVLHGIGQIKLHFSARLDEFQLGIGAFAEKSNSIEIIGNSQIFFVENQFPGGVFGREDFGLSS